MHSSDIHGRYFITPKQLLERFMIIGSMGSSYSTSDTFASFPEATINSVKTIVQQFPQDSLEVLARVVTLGKAPRKPPVILVLAAALINRDTRERAEKIAKDVIQTGTDQFVLTKFLIDLGSGKGRAFKRFCNILYSGMNTIAHGDHALPLNLIKYRNRAGWTHRDLVRVSHFKPIKENNHLFEWVVGKGKSNSPLIHAFEEAQHVTTPEQAVQLLVREPKLPWEALPTEVLGHASVWEALLPNLGSSALVRNLGRMQALEVNLGPYQNKIRAAASRQHPVAALSAWKVYSQGHGVRGSLRWNPNGVITEVLEDSFYQSFGTLPRSEAKVFFGLDVSTSMRAHDSTVAGLNCREVSAAMAMVAMKQQPYMIYGFSSSLIPLDIRDDWKLDQVISYINTIPYGATNCAAPMRFCVSNHVEDVDLFAIYTDNDTNSRYRPRDALMEYRAAHNPSAAMAVVSCMGSAFTIADPNDPLMLDVVGFDPSVPDVMLSLAEGNLV